MNKYLTEITLLVGVFAVYLITGFVFNDAYLIKWEYNISQIVRQASMLGIFAIGASIVIVAGGIDLSSGSMIAFGGSLYCMVVMLAARWASPTAEDPTATLAIWMIAAGILCTLVAAFLVGTLHTWLITVVELPPFVATLASLVGLRSLARIMNQAVTKSTGQQATKINIKDPMFSLMGQQWWIPLAILIVVAIAAWILMNRTVIGRHIYAMGGNEEAARLSGVRTDRLKWLAYCIGTLTAAIAGVLYSSEVGLADPQTQGVGYELFAIAASVVGGCSLKGGVGRVTGVVFGALFLRTVIDAVGKVIKAGSDDYEGLIVGLLVVLAVAFNQLSVRQAGWKKQFFPGLLGWITIPLLAALFLAVSTATSVLSPDGQIWVGPTLGLVTFVLLLLMKLLVDRYGRSEE
jgi:ribose/xylose/arabinose/galactoside ABC-type transport system permease subunit